MKIGFRTRKLEKEYKESKVAVKSYGHDVVRKYILRLNIIKQACDIEELKSLPGIEFHSLKGDRLGQYSMKLTGFYRLIVTLKGNPPEFVQIEEVSKHYGD